MSLNEAHVEEAALEWFGKLGYADLADKVANVSQVISATTEAKLIKLDQKAGGSRKFARYLPFWA